MSEKLLELKPPYLLFLGDVTQEENIEKTASGVLYWCPEKCVGQVRLEGCTVDLGLPDVTSDLMSGQKVFGNAGGTLVVGVANIGGYIPENWIAPLCAALDAGLDIAAGLHTRLSDIAPLRETAKRCGRRLYDVRQPAHDIPVGTGQKRPGKRLLTVGTDCAIGKMYSALALAREMRTRAMAVDFRATGQTGIFIAGSGISVDAVVADFISGAAEMISPANDTDHWDIIEGQGSLFHPAYAGVSLGLLHGSQPDAIVVCHDASRTEMHSVPGYVLPAVRDCIERNLQAARLTNPEVRAVGVSVNTSKLSEEEALAYMENLTKQLALPVCDPVRTGVSEIVDYLGNEL